MTSVSNVTAKRGEALHTISLIDKWYEVGIHLRAEYSLGSSYLITGPKSAKLLISKVGDMVSVTTLRLRRGVVIWPVLNIPGLVDIRLGPKGMATFVFEVAEGFRAELDVLADATYVLRGPNPKRRLLRPNNRV